MLSKYHADLTCLAIIVIPLLHGILDMTRILLHICRHAQQPVRPQRSRKQVQHVPANHPALQIPGDVRPWVREEDADLTQARWGDVSLEEHGGVGANQANILQTLFSSGLLLLLDTLFKEDAVPLTAPLLLLRLLHISMHTH